jgi:uncharacterized RDD family membrane protein YckC
VDRKPPQTLQPTSTPSTPALAGSLPVAEHGHRFKAYLIDAIIISVPTLALHAIVLGHLGAHRVQNLLLSLPAMAYFLFCPLRPGRRRGQTIGKQVMKLRIVSRDGERVSLGELLTREGFKLALWSITFLNQALGLLWLADAMWLLYNPGHRAVHDLVGGTCVVEIRA